MEKLFQTGNLIVTKSIAHKMYESGQFSTFCQTCLDKHKSGEWGDLEEEDIEELALLGIDGVLFPNAIVKISS